MLNGSVLAAWKVEDWIGDDIDWRKCEDYCLLDQGRSGPFETVADLSAQPIDRGVGEEVQRADWKKLLAFKMEILKRIQRHRQEMKHLTESPRRASRPDTVQ